MTELTAKDGCIRVQAYPQEKVILINRTDCLIVLCFCGRARSIVLHVQASDAYLPPLRQCTCIDTTIGELSTEDVDMWTNGGKVESMYAHLKRDE